MDLFSIVMTLWRHRIAVAVVAVLTALGAGLTMVALPSVYESTATLLLVPPPRPPAEAPAVGADNPYTRAYDASIVINVVAAAVTSDPERERLQAAGADPRYDVAQTVTYGFSSPVAEILGSGSTPEEAKKTAELVVTSFEEQLRAIQALEQVDERYFIGTRVVDPADPGTMRVSGKLRSVIAVVGLGVLALFAVVTTSDALAKWRAERGGTPRSDDGASGWDGQLPPATDHPSVPPPPGPGDRSPPDPRADPPARPRPVPTPASRYLPASGSRLPPDGAVAEPVAATDPAMAVDPARRRAAAPTVSVPPAVPRPAPKVVRKPPEAAATGAATPGERPPAEPAEPADVEHDQPATDVEPDEAPVAPVPTHEPDAFSPPTGTLWEMLESTVQDDHHAAAPEEDVMAEERPVEGPAVETEPVPTSEADLPSGRVEASEPEPDAEQPATGPDQLPVEPLRDDPRQGRPHPSAALRVARTEN